MVNRRKSCIASIAMVLGFVFGWWGFSPDAKAGEGQLFIGSRPVAEAGGGSASAEAYQKSEAKSRRIVFNNNTGSEATFDLTIRGVKMTGASFYWQRANTTIKAGDGFFKVLPPGEYAGSARDLDGNVVSKKKFVVTSKRDYVVPIGTAVTPPTPTGTGILLVNNTGVTWNVLFTLSSPSYLGGGELGYTFASQVPNLAIASALPPTGDLVSYTIKVTTMTTPAVTITAGPGTGVTASDGKTRTIVLVRNADGTYGVKPL